MGNPPRQFRPIRGAHYAHAITPTLSHGADRTKLQRTTAFITVPTAFSGQTASSGHVFAPQNNPLNAVAEGIRKNLKIFFSNFEVIVFMVYFFGHKKLRDENTYFRDRVVQFILFSKFRSFTDE